MGAHEPPTNRSFYLSLAASTLRFAIIVALVVGGIVVIDQAFPALSSGGGVPITGGGPGVTTTTAPPTGATGETGGEPERSPVIVGVRIAVFNGAGVSGLAGATQEELVDRFGYIAAQEPADAPSQYPVTTIYYRAPRDEIEAQYLANEYFRRLDDVVIDRLQPGTADIDRSAQIAIFLGIDWATLQAD